jgi:hypothetical protein
VVSDGRVVLELDHGARRPRSASAAPDAPEGHRVAGSAYLTMALLLDAVLDARRANPVNAA